MSENLKPRQSAVRILMRVLNDKQTLERAISDERDFEAYEEADKHFVTLLLLTTLRRLGQIQFVLKKVLQKPLNKKQKVVQAILELAVAQYFFLKTPEYAVVHTAVALTRKFHFEGLTGLVNGVLRHLMREQVALDGAERENVPSFLLNRWEKAYGSEETNKIISALLQEPVLDITVKSDAEKWAKKWNAVVLPTGSVRVNATNPTTLEEFSDGVCWVQNAAASVPAQLLSDIKGKRVADLCAAPGGKTAQLVCRGAKVIAVDISEKRLVRLKENMIRLGLAQNVEVVTADILNLTESEKFDAVLLDAPCSATGTIMRHPEIKYQRTEEDILRLSSLQKKLLSKVIDLVKRGGEIVFSTCSLEPEEGDEVVQSVLDKVEVLSPAESRWKPFINDFGSLRFLPSQGYDGFYACIMRKK